MSEKKVKQTVKKICDSINSASLTIPEIVEVISKVMYTVGANLAGFYKEGPSMETVEKAYYQNPTIDLGLMLQGLLISTWAEDFLEKPLLSKLKGVREEE